LKSLKVKTDKEHVGVHEVASITTIDQKTLSVACFKDGMSARVEKALVDSALGFTVTSTGTGIRVTMPAMTKEKRQEYVKLAKETGEKSRLALRQIREQGKK